VNILKLDHVGLHVTDVHAAVAFYRDVLRLLEIERPAFSFPGAWFRIGDDQELHLIGRPPETDMPPRERHWALRVDDIHAWAAHLTAQGISFRGPNTRPDGAKQIFFKDPDQHVIELCMPGQDGNQPAPLNYPTGLGHKGT